MYLDLYIQYDPIPELLIPSARTFWKCCNRQLKVGKLLAYNEFNSYPEVSGKMSTLSLQAFQDQVSELLLRHRSLIDVLSKTGQAGASVNRAVSKAITECGCIELHATKQKYAPESDIAQTKGLLETHVEGELCENCREVISSELGRNLFYMSALCNLLDINMEEVVNHESQKCSTLGMFNLS